MLCQQDIRQIFHFLLIQHGHSVLERASRTLHQLVAPTCSEPENTHLDKGGLKNSNYGVRSAITVFCIVLALHHEYCCACTGGSIADSCYDSCFW